MDLNDIGIEWELFENLKKDTIKKCKRNMDKMEKQYVKLIEKIGHDQAMYEFKRKFEKYVGEIIFMNDPLSTEEIDYLNDTTNAHEIFKMKINGTLLKCNIKRKIPTAKYNSLGISKYHYTKYKDKNIYLIFSIPNPYFYRTEKKYTLPEEHRFFLLNPNRNKVLMEYNGYVYFDLDELYDFNKIIQGQTELREFIK